MFSNNNNAINGTSATTNSREFDSQISSHKGSCNSTNGILASATASISSHNQNSCTSPSALSQHRISIHVKVEENSTSSTEDNSGSDALNAHNNNNNWPGACIYRCNINADTRRYIYNSDKCVEEGNDVKNHLDTDTNHLLALRDQFLCPGSAFSTNTQSNTQNYPISDNCKYALIVINLHFIP